MIIDDNFNNNGNNFNTHLINPTDRETELELQLQKARSKLPTTA